MALKTDRRFSVYMVTNSLTNQSYIGITSRSVANRWSSHKSQAAQNLYRTLFHGALRKHSPKMFTLRVLGVFDSYEKLLIAEKEFIAKNKTLHPSGYNMTIGGQGTIGYKWRDEDRAALSRKTKGRSMAHATAVLGNLGKPLSSEHRAKISAAHMGKIMTRQTKEHRAKISAALIGRLTTKTTRLKLSDSAKHRWSKALERDKASERCKALHYENHFHAK